MSKEEMNVTFITEGTACYLVKTETGVAIRDLEGNISEDATVSKDGLSYKLPLNAANRQWYMVAKAHKDLEANPDGVALTYKATRTLGEHVRKYPNEKLMAYMTEDELAEYKAIIEEAWARMDATRKKPMTEVDKLKAKIARQEALLAELLAKTENN